MVAPELPLLLELVVSALLVLAGLIALVGAIGLVALRDFFMRLHAPTKASTLGVGGVLIASMLYHGWSGQRLVIHELLITAFVFLTAPVASHLLMRTALERQPLPPIPTRAGEPPAAENAVQAEPPPPATASGS